MPSFIRNGLRLVYDCAGDPANPAVILLHGFTGERSNWKRHVEDLGADYYVMALDARGHGESDVPESLDAYAMDEFAADVLALADHIGAEKVSLVGCSFGGMTACHFATKWPERLWSVVLSDASPSYTSDRYHEEFRERERGIDAQDEIVKAHGIDELVRRATAAAQDPRAGEALARRYSRISTWGFTGTAHTRRTRPNLIPILREKLTMPVMLVTGELDPVRSAFRVMHEELPGARALTFKDTNHGVPMIRPALFLAELRDFYADVRAGKPVADVRTIQP